MGPTRSFSSLPADPRAAPRGLTGPGMLRWRGDASLCGDRVGYMPDVNHGWGTGRGGVCG